MTNAAHAERAAITAIETIFCEAGWSDGNNASRETVLHPASPLFFHGSTPAEASASVIIEDGIGRNIYALYSVVDLPSAHAGNRFHFAEATVAITIYYNDASTFDAGSVFNKYIDGLLSALADANWAVSYDVADDRIAASDREPYIYSKVIFAKNLF